MCCAGNQLERQDAPPSPRTSRARQRTKLQEMKASVCNQDHSGSQAVSCASQEVLARNDQHLEQQHDTHHSWVRF